MVLDVWHVRRLLEGLSKVHLILHTVWLEHAQT